MLTKLSQWVSIRFCPLLHRFLLESRDLECYVKPRRSSLFDVSFKTMSSSHTKHFCSKQQNIGTVLWATVPLLIYSLWEAVLLTVYGKPYALGLGQTKYSLPGYKCLYPGPHMHAMFSYSGDSAVSAPQWDKIYLRVISTLIRAI